MSNLSPEYFRRYLSVDEGKGVLTWLPRVEGRDGSKRTVNAWNARFAGSVAFTARDSVGYFVGAVKGKRLSAHRVCACMYFNQWPPEDVDHINGDISDNRKANLRLVSRTVNQRNVKLGKSSTTGFGGVTLCKRTGRYRAHAKIAGRTLHLGYFEKVEDAAAARQAFNSKNGFTDRHGALS